MTEQEMRVQRIIRMEETYDRCASAVAELLRAVEVYSGQAAALRELEAYYLSPLWQEDFFADRAGEIPQDLKRGILSEDAVYDLLTDQARLRECLKMLLED